MKCLGLGGLVVLMMFLSGCVSLTGGYYLESERYEDGIQAMQESLQDNPEDAEALYYLGRYFLALNKGQQALGHLMLATALEPDRADYAFWTGVAHWATLNPAKERESYLRAIELDPGHISAHLYLGHGYTDEGEWAKALAEYDTVLKLDKYNPEALYNRATVLSGLGRTEEEIAAWKKFLEYYPDGSLALQATQQLNLQGDFTYRNFILGQRNVTLRAITFKPGTSTLDRASKESLHVVKAMLKENDQLALHVVGYVEQNAALGKARAQAVRDYIINLMPGFDQKRLPLSWFDAAESIDAGGKSYSLDDSVSFITVIQ